MSLMIARRMGRDGWGGVARAVYRRADGTSGGRRAGLLRLGAAAVAAVLVAEAAVWALRPREDVVDPVPIAEDEYFDPAQIERAEDYRAGQRLLFFATLAIETGLLVTLALGRPARRAAALEALGRRPLLGAAAAGAGCPWRWVSWPPDAGGGARARGRRRALDPGLRRLGRSTRASRRRSRPRSRPPAPRC